MNKLKGIMDGVAAAAIWTILSVLGGFLLNLDKRIIWIIGSFFLFQGLVGYLIFNSSKKKTQDQLDKKHRTDIENNNKSQTEARQRLEEEFRQQIETINTKHVSEIESNRKTHEIELNQVRDKLKQQAEKISDDSKKRILQIEKDNLESFEKRTHHHHMFAHNARDLTVKMLSDIKIQDRQPNQFIVPVEFHDLLKNMLDRVARTFQKVAPDGSNVIAALRERRGENYYTILRAGQGDLEKREKTSQPIHVRNDMVETLIKSFRQNQDCVILTGYKKPHWHYNHDESRNEDRCVFLGAVFSKQWNKKERVADSMQNIDFDPIELEWILCVVCDNENAFGDPHKNLMKCFNDIFGAILNVFLRFSVSHAAEKKIPTSFTSKTK